MTDMSAELARREGNESPNTQSERSPPGSYVNVSPEPRTLAIERQPRVRRSVCVLLVVLAALFIITLPISGALIALHYYQNALAVFSATTPLPPFTTSTASTTYIVSTPHIITLQLWRLLQQLFYVRTLTAVPTATCPATDVIIILSLHGRPVGCLVYVRAVQTVAREPQWPLWPLNPWLFGAFWERITNGSLGWCRLNFAMLFKLYSLWFVIFFSYREPSVCTI